MAVFMKRDRFPLKEAEYEIQKYIESTGYEYIKTGFKPNQDTRVVLDMEYLSTKPADTTKTSIFLFGARNSSSKTMFHMSISKDTTLYDAYKDTFLKNTVSSNPKRLLIDKNKAQTRVNDIMFNQSASTFSTNCDIALLSTNTNGTIESNITIGRIYSCQIYDNDVLVRCYIPVKLRDSGEYGLWDLVEDKFYGNEGTGAFTGVEL